jgi:hypothetical protein
VKIGANDGFIVTGGSPKGWALSRKGKDYIFVPSPNPMAGRGLYDKNDPRVAHLV